MDRREALRVLGAATAAPLISRDLYALGQDARARWRARPGFRVLDAQQQLLVQTLTEMIIPTTDTPGAKGAGVDQFIDVMLDDWYDPADRQTFLDGLADVDARSKAATGKAFIDAAAAQQTALLTALDDELARQRSPAITHRRWASSRSCTRGSSPGATIPVACSTRPRPAAGPEPWRRHTTRSW